MQNMCLVYHKYVTYSKTPLSVSFIYVAKILDGCYDKIV